MGQASKLTSICVADIFFLTSKDLIHVLAIKYGCDMIALHTLNIMDSHHNAGHARVMEEHDFGVPTLYFKRFRGQHVKWRCTWRRCRHGSKTSLVNWDITSMNPMCTLLARLQTRSVYQITHAHGKLGRKSI